MSNPAIMMYVPFALNGQKNSIKVSLDSSDAVQTASYNYGFPDATMTPKASGGKPPNGKDFNGIFYAITTDIVHRQSGKQIQYDATYATNIGGYAKGSVLQSTDLTKSYISTADGNLTDPDSSSSKNWSVYSQPPLATSTTVGTVKITDTLTSTATDTALTANQGRVLANMMKSTQSSQNVGNNIMLWGGGITNSNGQIDVLFEQPLPNGILSVTATNTSSKTPAAFAGVGNFTKQGFTIYSATSSGVSSGSGYSYNWFVVGN